MKIHELIGGLVVVAWTAFALVTLPACNMDTSQQERPASGDSGYSIGRDALGERAAADGPRGFHYPVGADQMGYPMSVNMAADNLREAAEKAIEVDPYTARVVIAGVLANMTPAWRVPGPDVERIDLSWAPCTTTAPAARYVVHFEADFVVDQPELALWFETDQCDGYQYQVAGVGVDGEVGGFSAPVVRGMGAMRDDEIVEGTPCR